LRLLCTIYSLAVNVGVIFGVIYRPITKIAILSRCHDVANEQDGQDVTLGGAWRRAQRALDLGLARALDLGLDIYR